jgi:hypothetical protein
MACPSFLRQLKKLSGGYSDKIVSNALIGYMAFQSTINKHILIYFGYKKAPIA